MAFTISTLPTLSKPSQILCVGGGYGTSANPYTQDEFNKLMNTGFWSGGYVDGLGIHLYLAIPLSLPLLA